MCGIAGVLRISDRSCHRDLASLATAMSATLKHRGPDADGSWADNDKGIAVGHRRLSVIDLSTSGAQPMLSASGRYVLSYNGEIYNYQSLRQVLEAKGHRFEGGSDTEVLLAVIEHYGVAQSLSELIGMYAFALWDRQEQQLFLVRDRMGEKPLYYGIIGGAFVFASELKAFNAVPGWQKAIDRTMLAGYFHYGFVPGSRSIYSDIYRLLPGSFLQLNSPITTSDIHKDLSPDFSSANVNYQRYWQALAGPDTSYAGKPVAMNDIGDELLMLLRQSVERQCIADVPLGALLSGGIDSSTVVALMQEVSSKPVKTFSIGFEEVGYNEAHHAAMVADRLGTDHTELYVRQQDALDVIPNLSDVYDEPFADVSQIPTILVSRLARRHVTVALSGDGGDELFGGYTRYFWSKRIWDAANKTPNGLRKLVSKSLLATPVNWIHYAYNGIAPILPQSLRQNNVADKVHKLGGLLTSPSLQKVYQHTLQHWPRYPSLVMNMSDNMLLDYLSAYCPPVARTADMLYADTVTYLPDDILTKVDRASMAVSLEIRVPLLDHSVVEFAQRLPIESKIAAGKGKLPLRNVLDRYLEAALYDRPKAGFGVPIGAWLRGSLRDWADDMLSADRIERGGYIDAKRVSACWSDHRSGKGNWQYQLWDVLMFESWRESVGL